MTQFNTRRRLLTCLKCKQDYVYENYPNPKCPECGLHLITVLFSIMTGSRITGVEPLTLPPILLPGVKT